MSNHDGFTVQIQNKLDEFSKKIWDIDDGLSSISDNEDEIIAYLHGIRSTSAMGIALRRYLCRKFGTKLTDGGYSFILQNGMALRVGNYLKDDYDIENDDIKVYSEVFYDIYLRYNRNMPIPKFTKAEARRLLRMNTPCQRKKMFIISFALHVNTEDMDWFLMDVLAEQSYNMRSPQEIIAYFCHSQEQFNSYEEYVCLIEQYLSMLSGESMVQKQQKINYTLFATCELKENICCKEELFSFLLKNQANFCGVSQTAYHEFRQMYDKACSLVKIQMLSNDEYLIDRRFETEQQRLNTEERINRALVFKSIDNSKVLADELGVEYIGNPEQLAHRMLEFIPRATFKKTQGNKAV